MKEPQTPFVFDEMMRGDRARKSRLALATMLGSIPSFDLACVGTSIHGLGALTFEALSYLVSADIVFYYPPTAKHYDLLKLINDNVVNLHETLYVRGEAFEPTYATIIEHVMSTVREGKKIVYATQGSPLFHCGTCIALYRRAKREGFTSVLVGGVSSFELLSAELAETYDLRNVQLYSVVDVMAGKCVINPRVPCLLINFGRYALPSIRGETSTLERPKVKLFAKLLAGLYPIDHELKLIYTSPVGTCSTVNTGLAALEHSVLTFDSAALTIFLPPSDQRGHQELHSDTAEVDAMARSA